ncbi:hypothetical protein K439DRAFT_1623418 [Ramaria rubella]|nr:hypothetical protein K439DRAFT_1623418 [Ramaria rubella]
MPKPIGEQFHGGTAFERSKNRAKPVESGCRCYQYMMLTTQKPRDLTTPNLNSKYPDNADRQLRQDIHKPLCQAVLASINMGPSYLLDATHLRASIVGLPNLGVDDNVQFAAFQLNFSKCYEHGKVGALFQDMGFFGGMHVDAGDASYLSNLTILSDLPCEYYPGVFMLYKLGIYIRMDLFIGVNFSGLRLHRGMAPTAPPGVEPVSWGYRFASVSYAPSRVMDMSSHQALAILPGGNMLFVTPEMSEHTLPSPRFNVPSNQSNHVVDGVGLMTRQAHTSFIARMCLRVVQYITSQLPAAYRMHVNPMTFMQAFEFEREDGTNGRAQSNTWDHQDQYGAATSKFIPLLANWDAESDTFRALVDTQSQVHLAALDRVSLNTVVSDEIFGHTFVYFLKKKIQTQKQSKLLHVNDHTEPKLTRRVHIVQPSLPSDVDQKPVQDEHRNNEGVVSNNNMDIDTTEALNDATATCSNITSENIRPDCHTCAPFLHDLSIESLQSLRENACESIQRTGPNLRNLCLDLHEKPFKDGTLLKLKDAWQLIVGGKHNLAQAEVKTVISRQFTMLATARAWAWLESQCRRVLQGHFSGIDTPGAEWLQALGDNLATYYMSCNQYVYYVDRCNSEPFKDLPSKRVLITPSPTIGRGGGYPLEDEARVKSVDVAVKTIATWLDYPDVTSNSRVQGAFTTMLIDIYGSLDVLLLDFVWHAFCHLKPRLFGNRKMKTVENTDLVNLRNAIQSHPIMDFCSEARQQVDYGSWSPYHSIDNTPPAGHQVATFLLLLLPILEHLEPKQDDSTLFEQVKTDLDFYLPFRNVAPSQSHVLHKGGGTFSSPAILDNHHNRFDTLSDWNEYHDLHSHLGSAHFCNMTAYGTPNVFRGPNQIETYWKGMATWEKTLQRGFNTFTKLWEYLMHVKKGYRRKVFPHIGNLSSYLLATDIVYTGLVPHATAKEVGNLIHFCRKGFDHQMVELKLIDQKSDAKDCGMAYEKLYDKLVRLIPYEECEQMKFDVYSTEYALCKRSRFEA